MRDEYTDDFVPSWLNTEAIVILGMTETELMVSIILSMIFSSLIAVPFIIFLSFMVGLVIFLASFVATLMGVSKFFKIFKSGKPRGYIQALIKHKSGLHGDVYMKDESLTIGRTNKRVRIYEK